MIDQPTILKGINYEKKNKTWKQLTSSVHPVFNCSAHQQDGVEILLSFYFLRILLCTQGDLDEEKLLELQSLQDNSNYNILYFCHQHRV